MSQKTALRLGYFLSALAAPALFFFLRWEVSFMGILSYEDASTASGLANSQLWTHFVEWTDIALWGASILLFGVWYRKGLRKKGKLSGDEKGRAIRLLTAAAAGGALWAVLSALLYRTVGETLTPGLVYRNYAAGEGLFATPTLWLSAVLLAPLAQELLFRGVQMRAFTRAFGGSAGAFWAANILQAVFYGLLAGDAAHGLCAFVFGIFLGFLSRGGDLLPAMAAHMAAAVLTQTPPLAQLQNRAFAGGWWAFTLTALAAVLFALWRMRKGERAKV